LPASLAPRAVAGCAATKSGRRTRFATMSGEGVSGTVIWLSLIWASLRAPPQGSWRINTTVLPTATSQIEIAWRSYLHGLSSTRSTVMTHLGSTVMNSA
jgi:hypothetical protein